MLTDKYVEHILQPPTERTLLSQMIYHGKKIYVKDVILPIKVMQSKCVILMSRFIG